MMGDFWVLRTELMREQCIDNIKALALDGKKPYQVQIKSCTERRSDAQNRLSHLWYSEVAKQGKEYTHNEIHCRAKKHYGVPILLAENPDFHAAWQKAIQVFPSYEEQCDQLLKFFPVTSLLNTEQMSRYLSDFQRVQGAKHKLTDPQMMGL